jgi:hypothetical protein
MQPPVSEVEGTLGSTCMGRYHGTGMVVGKAGRSLIAGLKHQLRCQSFFKPSASLGQPFELAHNSGDNASASGSGCLDAGLRLNPTFEIEGAHLGE